MPRPPRFGVPGLTLKRGRFVFQPPARSGHRPPPVHLHTADLAQAIIAAGHLARQQSDRACAVPLADLIAAYLDAKRASGAHKSETTTRSALPGLRRFQDRFRVPAARISGADLERWRDSMTAEGLSPASVASYLRYAQSFCSWAVRCGHLGRSPFADAKNLFPKSLPTRRDRYCSGPLRDRLLRECADPDLAGVLHLGFLAGLRRQEILAVRPHWILCDPMTGRPAHLRVQNEPATAETAAFATKNGRARVIPIATPLAEFLVGPAFQWTARHPYLIAPDRPAGRWLYRWEWKHAWATYMRRQECAWVTPHIMRHTFVTLLLSAPPDRRPSLLHLSRWTGTAVETLDRHYAHLIDDPSLINAAN